MRGTALTVEATKSIAEALRMPCPKYRILRTCVPGRMTKAERTGAEVLDRFFPDTQFSLKINHWLRPVSERCKLSPVM